jgi:hypothetical protein
VRPGRKKSALETAGKPADRRRGEKSDATFPAIEAIRLLGKWQQLASGHVVIASGCSCGTDVGALPVKGFERDILDYLYAQHGDRPFGTIAEMLISMAKQRDEAGANRQLALLGDLERSIESFAELHR